MLELSASEPNVIVRAKELVTDGTVFGLVHTAEIVQSASPRGARQYVLFHAVLKYVVSIHAPARGATVKIIQYEAIPHKLLCFFLGTNDFK